MERKTAASILTMDIKLHSDIQLLQSIQYS